MEQVSALKGEYRQRQLETSNNVLFSYPLPCLRSCRRGEEGKLPCFEYDANIMRTGELTVLNDTQM